MDGSTIKKIIQDDNGATALEFALVGPVFFGFIFMNLYIVFLLLGNFLLAEGASRASELIKKERIANSVLTEEDVRAAVCDTVKVILSCEPNKLIIFVKDWKKATDEVVDFPVNESVFDYNGSENIHFLRVSYAVTDSVPTLSRLVNGNGTSFLTTPTILTTKEEIPRNRGDFND